MASSAANRPRVENPEATRDDWVRQLHALVDRIRGWVEKSGWKTREIQRSLSDSILGEYKAPALLMQRETAQVILDPVGRFAPGTDGVVDLYLLPAYGDIASLYLVDGAWRLHHAFRDKPAVVWIKPAEAMPLDEDSLARVLEEIAADAA